MLVKSGRAPSYRWSRPAPRGTMHVVYTKVGVSNGSSHQSDQVTKWPEAPLRTPITIFCTFAVHACYTAFTVLFRTAWREVSWCLLATDLIDLTLEVVDHLGRHLVTEDLEQINALVTGNRLVCRQFDALLNLSQ